MKILHVSPSMDPKLGGVCQAVRLIISGLSTLGVENEVVSLDASDAKFLKEDPFPVHGIGIGQGPWSRHPQLIPWLVVNLPRFDAIVVHGLWLYYGYAVRKAIGEITGKKPKLFVMPHGMLDPYFQRAAGRKLKALRNFIYWKLIEGKLINMADGILFTCEEECRLAREPFRPYKPKRELVVGLGSDQPPAYTPAMAKSFSEKVPELGVDAYILFLSRIHEKKGVDLLIKAYGELATKKVKGTPQLPKLVIAGPGLESNYGQDMKHLAYDTLRLGSSVFFPGMLTGDAKWGAFYGCEAFVLPSHQENFGIAVVEALACAKPVLISNQVNIWREIESGGGGLIADDTMEGTTHMLERWYSMPDTAKKSMVKNAKDCFINSFEKGPASRRFLEKINSL
ncbi:glycosyltransferase [Chryseolinea sp. H1M3-3]|uniref:glycosyltransferase n=1 Tax=Chryseolinea sp. H1M3-3 TaxID=3034144 RepID=UPI0023EB226C|nr:glycosyltransferase [Chryseolinea sp. H1M3-3]